MRTDAETRDWTLTADRMGWLTGCLTLVLAPHALRIPVWISAVFVVFAAWRLASVARGVRLPPRWLVAVVTLAMLAGVYLSFGTLFGRTAGVALLVMLAGMKLVETRNLRDAFVVNFLGYFLVITNFLFSQSIATGLYMLVIVLLMTATLVALTTSALEVSCMGRVRLAGTLLVQALPLMLVLFVLFPRVPGPLWGLPKDAHGATSGLTDRMSPGNISRLTLSDAVAFRVEFDGAPPPPAQRYWRGPVLWHTDGRTWRAARRPMNRRAYPGNAVRDEILERRGTPVDYQVTLEPHQRRWLFALELPWSVPPSTLITHDMRLLAPRRVRERMRYRVSSYPQSRLTRLAPRQRLDALRLPPGRHPRARDLAQTWRATGDSEAEIVQRALAHFRTEPFYYTLTPPLLEGDSVDAFLFGTRRGFCEHYAAAFTVLMRAAGIPARVVTGYQGGEMNPLGDYMIIRQRDAHAWTEVWLNDRGWVRADPTAAVSPDRIERGMDGAIPPPIGPRALGFVPSEPVRRLWQRLRHGWDAVNNTWNQWVLGYGPVPQQRLLGRLGIDARDYRQLAVVLAAVIGFVFAAVGVWMLRVPAASEPAVRLYRRFCRRLARAGLGRRPSEGPVDFAARVCALRPDIAAGVGRITALYVAARYAAEEPDTGALKQEVARFKA